jgi:hypothetical protein
MVQSLDCVFLAMLRILVWMDTHNWYICAATCPTCIHTSESITHDVNAKSMCVYVGMRIDMKHRCLPQHSDSLRCPDACSVPQCQRQCCHASHFHGLDVVLDSNGAYVPRERHICE